MILEPYYPWSASQDDKRIPLKARHSAQAIVDIMSKTCLPHPQHPHYAHGTENCTWIAFAAERVGDGAFASINPDGSGVWFCLGSWCCEFATTPKEVPAAFVAAVLADRMPDPWEWPNDQPGTLWPRAMAMSLVGLGTPVEDVQRWLVQAVTELANLPLLSPAGFDFAPE
jgi:hypothetical protein